MKPNFTAATKIFQRTFEGPKSPTIHCSIGLHPYREQSPVHDEAFRLLASPLVELDHELLGCLFQFLHTPQPTFECLKQPGKEIFPVRGDK